MIVAASALYLWGVRRAHARGVRWPLLRTIGFLALGMGSYAAIELGFLGVWSDDLRWAFTTRIALLIFVVPGGIAVGRPLELAAAAGGPGVAERIDRIVRSKPARLWGNAMAATILIAAVLCVFLTPLAGVLRTTPGVGESLGVIVPLVGLALVLPMGALGRLHTGLFLAIEFLLAFVELLIDSIPGLLLRLSDTAIDTAGSAADAVARAGAWWPSPLHDQHLAGDILWFIAEVSDVPILVLLLVRWMRADRTEAQSYDDLSDEEYDALTQAHLRGEGASGTGAPAGPRP